LVTPNLRAGNSSSVFLQKKIMRKISFLIILFPALVIAQTGRISGVVVDSKTGETLPGATTLIEGTNKGAQADFDGKFSINNVTPGKVNLLISYISYTTKKVAAIDVKANDETVVNISLDPSSSQDLTEVEVVVTLNKENNTALVLQQKNNASVSDGVSAETIKRTPDRNTSDVLKRVSGATIQDNKFAIVRGLNDRYNTAYLNGAPLPSTESDRKAFSFDIFPSNMLDNLVIYKTTRPDMPGEFAGGIIEITTKSIPEKNFITVSTGIGYNTVTTGKEKEYLLKGKSDWLGLDGGARSISNQIPDQLDFSVNINDQAAYAKSVDVGSWSPKTGKFAPNTSYQVSAGYNFKRKEKDFFGVLASVSYNNTNNYITTNRTEYFSGKPNDAEDPLIMDKNYLDKTYQNQNLVGVLLNLASKVNPNNTISSKNLYSINTDDRTIARSGMTNGSDQNPTLVKSNAFWYTQNNILSNQLIGEHFAPKAKIKINWNGAYTQVNRIIPNLKRTLYTRKQKLEILYDADGVPFSYPSDTIYQAQVPASATAGPDYSGVFLDSKLKEAIKSFKLDISKAFKFSEKWQMEAKLGCLSQLRMRQYTLRQFSYSKYGAPGQPVSFNNNLLFLSPDSLYTQQNMGLIKPGVGGLKLTEDNKYDQGSYNASSNLNAAYAMIDVKYRSILRLVTGMRFESYRQRLDHPGHLYYYDHQSVYYDTVVNDFLPSANLIVSLSEKQNLRFGYAKSLNRPEFREIAPLIFYDFNTNLSLSGDPTLKRAVINNYDCRYEIFPGAGQLASVSFFYKEFTNPIELVQSLNAREITYRNAPKASCQGMELEYRFNLGILTKKDSTLFGRFLNNLTLFSNFSYIKSRVDIVGTNISNKGQKIGERQMQGQSPYIINTGLSYIDNKLNYSISVSYNRFGSRIYVAGNINDLNKDGTGNIWEVGRNVLDLQLTKSFFKNKLEIRFNIKDALAKKQVQKFNIDFANNATYNPSTVAPFWQVHYGTTYSLLLSYKF
jgi:TonB-dependent receptor